MQSLKCRLQSAKGKLRSTSTHVKEVDGREYIEAVDREGRTVVTAQTSTHCGYIVDDKPDMQMAFVHAGLYVGSQDPAAHLPSLQAMGITHIINCAPEAVPCHFGDRFTYLELVELRDTPETDIRQHFDRCYNLIDTCVAMGGACFVHCNAGVSRASTICIAYLMRRCDKSLIDALAQLRRARPCTMPNAGFMKQLQAYDEVLGEYRRTKREIHRKKNKT